MKTLSEIGLNNGLEEQINKNIKLTGFCKADVIRQALRIGLPQLAARFQSAPLWLEERIRGSLTEPAEDVTPEQFKKNMKAIAGGR